MCIRCDLQDRFGELLFVEPEDFDNAIIGVSVDRRVVYDALAVVEQIMQESGFDREKAHEALDAIATTLDKEHSKRNPTPQFTWIDWELLDKWADPEAEDEHEQA